MTAPERAEVWAKEIRLLKASRVLEVVWEDDTRRRYAFSTLRAHCRCAECRRLSLCSGLEAGMAGDDLDITDIRPIGTYALQFAFSDGHARGIYPFRYLRGLNAQTPAV